MKALGKGLLALAGLISVTVLAMNHREDKQQRNVVLEARRYADEIERFHQKWLDGDLSGSDRGYVLFLNNQLSDLMHKAPVRVWNEIQDARKCAELIAS